MVHLNLYIVEYIPLRRQIIDMVVWLISDWVNCTVWIVCRAYVMTIFELHNCKCNLRVELRLKVPGR